MRDRVVALVARFRHHVAMAVGVEPVDEHAAEARHRADVLARQRGQRFDAAGIVHLQQKVADERIQVAEIGRFGAVDGFEFDDGDAVPAMRQHVEMAAVAHRDRAHVERARAQLHRQFGCQLLRGRVAEYERQRLADGVVRRHARPGAEVGAGLQHDQVGGQCQQETMRLDAAGRADRFLVAGRQVEDGSGDGLVHGWTAG
jgi:hypothetical protein